MGNENFEQIGVEAVFAGINQFLSDMDKYRTSIDTASKSNKRYEESVDDIATTAKSGSSGIKSLVFGFAQFNLLPPIINDIVNFTDGVGDLTSGFKELSGGGVDVLGMFTGLLNPVTIVTGLVVGLGAAFIGLGVRGAALDGIGESFDILAAKANIASDALLGNLRTAAAGTISDFELMRATNNALTGATDELILRMGQDLPLFLNTARSVAAATGGDVQQLFNDLINGTRKASPELLNNLGIIVKAEDAYASYAEANNLVAAALDDNQKSMAIYNEVIAQASNLAGTFGDVQETASDKIARMNATVANIFDNLAISVQPAFEAVLDGVNFLLGGLSSVVSFIAPIITEVLRRVGSVFSFISGIITPPIQFVINSIASLVQFTVDNAGVFFEGAGRLVGAYANGLLAAANAFVYPAVISIATFIADFLVGLSPPKKGALSKIDTGGENVMKAWLDGFTGVPLTPVEEITKNVNTALGDIGNMDTKQVEARMKEIAASVKPFEENLALAEARLEELKAPAEAMLETLERQSERLQAQVAQGVAGADEQLATILRMKAATEKGVMDRQEEADLAKIQLAITQSQYTQELALLNIQKSRLQIEEDSSKVGKKKKGEKAKEAKAPKEPKEPKAPKGKGGVGAPEIEAAAPTDLINKDLAKMEDAIENPLEGLDLALGSFGEGFQLAANAGGELDKFGENSAALQEQLGRISESDPVQGFVSAFSGIGESLNESFVMPIQDAVGEVIAWFTDPAKEGGLASFFNTLTTEGFGFVAGDVGTAIGDWAQIALIDPIKAAVDLVLSVFRDPSDPNSLFAYFAAFQEDASLVLGNLSESIDLWVDMNIVQPMRTKISELLDPENENSIVYKFAQMPVAIGLAIGDMLTFFRDDVFGGMSAWVIGDSDDGGLPQLIDNLIQPFNYIREGVWNAIKNIGLILWSVLVVPFIEAINSVIRYINEFIDSIISSDVGSFARTIGVPLPTATGFQEISANPPMVLLNPPRTGVDLEGAESGGMFGAGGIQWKERGNEYAFAAEPFLVYNNRFIRAMDMFSSAFMDKGRAFNPSGITNNNTVTNNNGDNVSNVTINNASMFTRGQIIATVRAMRAT